MNRLLEALHSGRVLLMDGAMGTELQRRGLADNEPPELWNLTHPERVRAIHRAYVEAGAEVLLTNTFQASEANLVGRGLVQQFFDIWNAGVDLARASTIPPFIMVSLGPCEWHWARTSCWS